MFIGDFIYDDQPLTWGRNAENYARKYREVWSQPSIQRFAKKVPIFHMIDDHGKSFSLEKEEENRLNEGKIIKDNEQL